MNVIESDRVQCTRPDWNLAGPSRVCEISVAIRRGEFVGFHGPDGCGKGLLLNVLGLLERADSGRVSLLGRDMTDACDDERADFRNEHCGYLFRHPYLLPSFTVAENIAMPLFRIRSAEVDLAEHRTRSLLEFTGMLARESDLAGRLGPRERWCTAFARALVHDPEILVGISPPAGAGLLQLARRAADEFGTTIIWAGERPELAAVANRLYEMSGGTSREEDP